jgi:N-acyl-L-homoserine lactone synthetase
MSIQIGKATTSKELDAVFRLRHDVFTEEGTFEATGSGRIVDRFDAFPGVVNIVARVDDEIIGSVRFMEYSEAGASAEDWFDFTPHLPTDGRIGSASQLVVHKDYRFVPGLTVSMISMGYAWCLQRQLTHLTSAANPEVAAFLKKSGWQFIGQEFLHAQRGVIVQPTIINLDHLNRRFQEFIRKQHIEHVFYEFERGLFRRGEILCQIGDRADYVYVVVDGELRVTNREGRELSQPGPGEIVGEIAILTDQYRTANVESVRDTWVMMLSREVFNKQLAENPAAARSVLELLARRLASADSTSNCPDTT